MQVGTLTQVGTIPLERAEEVPLPDWKMLAQEPEEELGKLDIALVNFVAHMGLPDSEKLNPWGCIRRLDAMAEYVRAYTNWHLGQFRRNPANFENSEAYFRALCMVTVLQKEFGVRYNPEKIPRGVPHTVEDTSIHGIIFGGGGTCASLPVLYAAIGRRLGYPIKLVSVWVDPSVSHLFARWDGGGERFNIEVTATGLATPPDDRYRGGKYQMTPQIETWGRYLLSHSPREELSGFLVGRGLHLRNAGQWPEWVDVSAWALALDPENKVTEDWLRHSLNAWTRSTEERQPQGFPSLTIWCPPGYRFYPVTLPLDYERQILGLLAVEDLLTEGPYVEIWEQMRRGEWKGRGPNRATMMYRHDGTSLSRVEFKQ